MKILEIRHPEEKDKVRERNKHPIEISVGGISLSKVLESKIRGGIVRVSKGIGKYEVRGAGEWKSAEEKEEARRREHEEYVKRLVKEIRARETSRGMKRELEKVEEEGGAAKGLAVLGLPKESKEDWKEEKSMERSDKSEKRELGEKAERKVKRVKKVKKGSEVDMELQAEIQEAMGGASDAAGMGEVPSESELELKGE